MPQDSTTTPRSKADTPSSRPDGHVHACHEGGRPAQGDLESNQVLCGLDLEFTTCGTPRSSWDPAAVAKVSCSSIWLDCFDPDSGKVWFDEHDRIDQIQGSSRLGPFRRRIGFLFQQGALFDSMSVGDNVALSAPRAFGDLTLKNQSVHGSNGC